MRDFTRIHRFAKASAIDVRARVVHSRSSINTRDFRKVKQSLLSFLLVFTLSHSISLSLSVTCHVLYSTVMQIHGDLVATTMWLRRFHRSGIDPPRPCHIL